MQDVLIGAIYGVLASVFARMVIRRAHASPRSHRPAWMAAGFVMVFGLIIGMAAVAKWSGAREGPTMERFANGVLGGVALGAFVIWPLLLRWRNQR